MPPQVEAVLERLVAQVALVRFPEGDAVFRVKVVDVTLEIAVRLEVLAARAAEMRHASALRRVMRMMMDLRIRGTQLVRSRGSAADGGIHLLAVGSARRRRVDADGGR